MMLLNLKKRETNMHKNRKIKTKKHNDPNQNDFYFEDLKRIKKENKRRRNRMTEE